MPTTPPATDPTNNPPAQPQAPRRITAATFQYNLDATPDPTNPANYFSPVQGQLPQSGDTVQLLGSTMTLHGHTLDGVQIVMGRHAGMVAMPDPVLNMTGDAVPTSVAVWCPPDEGSHAIVNVTGENALNAMIAGSGDALHPTKSTMEINVADNAMMDGQITVVDSVMNIRAQGPNATFNMTGPNDSDIVRAHGSDGFIHIEPNMIGTGKMQLHFSNLELGGSVTPQLAFDVSDSSELKIDHADTFHGIINLQAGSTLFLKDMHPLGVAHGDGGTFGFTDASGRSVDFQMHYDTAKYGWNAAANPDGLSVYLVAK
jgi:hypothetical protein